jgi:hypothetical protein
LARIVDDEIEPRVLDSSLPDVVIWSSLCPGRPDGQIRFDLPPAASGSLVRWTLSTPGEAPDESKIGHLRLRLNVLINEKLRYSFGQ